MKNSSDSIQGGTAAFDFMQSNHGEHVPQAPDSVTGGSAATNFAVNPQWAVPMGGTDSNADIARGGAYKTPAKVSTGGATADRAK